MILLLASGSNSCLPHAQVTNRIFRTNDVVLVDMGIDVKGYKSDLTRMFFLGKIPRFVSQVNQHVDTAQKLAIEKIKAGVSASLIDQQARNYLKKHNLAQNFSHACGHGVGLDIHEYPRLSEHSSDILKEGMVITVEPAVYISHKFGVRIEDMILVTKKGYKNLSEHIY